MKQPQFEELLATAFHFKGKALHLGNAMLDRQTLPKSQVRVPLQTLNRHGLITGATGTGKTKTLQLFAEMLSEQGIPVLLMDIKGDMSGLAKPGVINNKIEERYRQMNATWLPKAYPVELLTLSNESGVRLRASVMEFGPVLLSKILGLNDTQSGIISLLFKYCDDNKMPLLDLQDLQKMLQWTANEGKAELAEEFGTVSTASVGTIMRKIVELQQQGADQFFGEPSFDTDDLIRLNDQGEGIISILRVTDLQDRPKLFSTFMLQLLSELYASMPEEGDLEQPKLIMVIDEAHLIFSDASKALLSLLETVIKLIRSKGVGIYFCTQNPTDIPSEILSQLGLKIQHALRAFTARDRKNIRLTAANYPITEYYNTEELITQLGIGEALITLLNEKGIPTPLVHTLLRTPRSRMDILDPNEISELVRVSSLVSKYSETANRESAAEMLAKKVEIAASEAPANKKNQSEEEESVLEKVANNSVVRSMMRTAGNALVRSLLGSLGVSGTTRRRRKSNSWF